jgi:hypothetical protein
LRQTFPAEAGEEKGVHYAPEASGLQSDRYIKPDWQTLAQAIDDLDL